MTPPLHAFESKVAEAWPAASWCETHVLVGVSGGPDSVAMLRALVALKRAHGGSGRLFVGHLHHGLRGADADADAKWLVSLCAKLELPLELARGDVASAAQREGDGLEAAARAARYDFFQRTAEKVGARYVAVAHTADDQVETVLHRILRGTGLAGLAGMSGVRRLSPSASLVRPMLNLRRSEVLDYLAAIGQDFRTDRTNTDLRFTRNKLRHELLPALRRHYNADVDEALLRLAAQARESQQIIKGLAASLAEVCVTLESGTASTDVPQATAVRIECKPLRTEPEIIVREICRTAWAMAGWPEQAMGYEQWQQLASHIAATDARPAANLPSGVRASREGAYLILQKPPA